MDNLSILWIVLLPLAGAIINGVGARVGVAKSWITTIGVGSVLGAFGLALHNFIKLWELKHGVDGVGGVEDARLVADVYEWFSISISSGSGGFREVPIHVRFVFDSLSGLMTLVVTGIGSLIHIYSVEYMSEEKSYARFFAYLNLFTASMLVLVLASSFPLMFVGWEGVGLCSYLLIGFWFETPAYAAAGRKAFVANRVGDFGVLIGMFTLVMLAGSFEFDAINAAAPELARPMVIGGNPLTISMATFACLFLFLGCSGKSAQLPLYVWLPDAMAGPTPVSALIHAATMVTAGVYLCCRLSPVFLESPTALGVIALVGAATAFLGATIAVVQREMKKILAYSTVSQLGFMFAAVGVGAFTAGFFHVFTHAFFKACLFLGAGAVMHAVHAHGDADIFKLGGLAKKLPVVRWTFLISCLAIAGVPGFSGFFSKDEILLGATTIAMVEGLPIAPWIGWVVAITLTIAATLTAFYMFRLYYLTFTGDYRSAKHEDGHGDDHGHGHDDHGDHGHGYDPHPHAPHFPIRLALSVLGLGALTVGFLGLPHHWFPNWWHHWMAPSISGIELTEEQAHHMAPVWAAMAMGLFAMFAGVGAATVIYRGKNEDTFTPKLPKKLFDFLFDKWRVDELYDATIIRLNKGVAMLSGRVDKSFIDGVLTGLPAKAIALGGHLFSRLQVGVVHAYGLVLVLGLAGVSWWFLYPHAELEVEATAESATLTAGRGMGYEYRFDLDGDGTFDVPRQPTRVTIDLADDATDAQVFRVAALVRAAIAPVQWPADRAALGHLVSRGRKIYELTPPVAELPDLEAALERAEGVEDVRFEAIASERQFAREPRAEATSYDDKDRKRSGIAVLLVATREGPVQVRLTSEPTRLDLTLLFGPAGMPPREEVEGEEERTTLPPYAWVEDGKVVIRPNVVASVVAGEGAQERIELAFGESTRLGLAAVRAVPVVRATVEVRNAFGNVASETVDVVLDSTTSDAHAALLNPEMVR
ncbi:MAG: NADH-quinone oxidoreductase subunit L [Sandaracinus sp.]|nr:NADH-quinone oxidoreductase subunit L [Sandaracinus sp.]